MRVPHNRRGGVGINMTPMIDVTFLLIVFFLVSSHLAKQEAQLPLPLPVAESGASPRDSETRRVTINVLADGQLLLAGKLVAPDQLQTRLRAASSESAGDFAVRIRGHRRVAYREVEPVLWACAQAGIWNVSFAVYRPEDAR